MASALDPSMRRVLVIGSPGAGKSTLAARLGARLGVPVHYLDLHHWDPGWKYRDGAQAREATRALTERPAWVMDGNFAETFDLRMPRADTLVWLDYPRATCIRRILMRTVKDYGKRRADLPEGCPETFDAAMLGFAWRFPAESRPQIFAAIERYGSHLQVFRLGNDRAVADFSRGHGLGD
jgi:adenylate kinase family enzyme